MSARNHTMNADPSVRQCAESLMVDAMGAIESSLLRGVGFYVARDRAIEERADAWVSRFGKDAADQAVRGLHMLSRDECLSDAGRRALRDREAEAHRLYLRVHDTARDTWWNRASIAVFGVPFYALVLACLAASAVMGGPAPAQASSGQHVDAKWRALAACGVAKPGPGRDRACRRFNSAERETWRSYDGPGAGAPREWELPRSWDLPD